MTDFSTSRTIVARKSHRCEHCRQPIDPGVRHLQLAGKWQGDFYACRVHDDCNALWDHLFHDWGDPYDGMEYDLIEVLLASGELQAAQESLDARRGFLPHAVCRIEFRLRKWLEITR
jgi:hypothetical protein